MVDLRFMRTIKGIDERSGGPQSGAAPNCSAAGEFRAGSNNPMVSIGKYLLLAYTFLAFSRVLDLSPSGLRLPLVLFIFMSLATLISGRLFECLYSPIGRWMFGLSLWFVVTIPFSSWPGGSAPYIIDTYRSFIFGAVIVALIVDTSGVFKLIRTIAYSILVGALLSFVFGKLSYGRLILPEGTFGDPNMLAMALLFSIPLWLWIAKGVRFPAKFIPLLCIVPIFVAFLRTGSRGAAIGFLAFCLVLFWQATLSRKIPMVGLIACVILGSLALLPDYLKERYFTFFTADTAQVSNNREREMLEGADVGSSEGRLTLLLESIHLTATHPLFGVGAGQFAYQAWEHRHESGLPVIYNVTHNTYTQISSELGVPGLILFVGLLISSFRAIQSVRKLKSSRLYRLPPMIIETADTLLLALIVLSVCAFFLSLAYGPFFFVMPAIIAVFYRAVMNSLPGWQTASHFETSGAALLSNFLSPSPQVTMARFARRITPRG